MLRLGKRIGEMAAEGSLADGQRNATFDAQGASTFTVAESLSVCQQLLESSWQRFNSVHSNKIWNDALDSAIKGCKGLLNLATERHVQELESEKNLWFVLFLTFSGISLIAICAMLYLISSMRTFVSLKKCLMSRWESRETRPRPEELVKTVLTPINTRPMVKNSDWARKDSSQKQTQPVVPGQPSGPSLGHSIPYIQNQVTFPYNTPGGYPVTIMPTNIQPGMSQDNSSSPEEAEREATEAKTSQNNKELLAKIETRFQEYQRSLWELQRAGMPGLPHGMYPSVSNGHLSTLEGEL